MRMKKRILYAFWGHLADRRVKNGKPLSAPNGNSMYSWTIIDAFMNIGYEVWRGMPDRDEEYVKKRGRFAFAAFSPQSRWRTYTASSQVQFDNHWRAIDWPEVDVVLLEWRFPIPGRNCGISESDPAFDPDLIIQDRLIEHYRSKGTPIIAFDLDLEMTQQDEQEVDWVYELGFSRGPEHHVDPMCCWNELDQFQTFNPKKEIAYIGNRYDRDGQFEKYLGQDLGILARVYGNWLEKDRDSAVRWPHIRFGPRIHPESFHEVYMQASVVPLILRDKYNEYGWMTFRFVETLLFGSIPALPIEFQSPMTYVPHSLRIGSQEELVRLAKEYARDWNGRKEMRKKIINYCQFLDASVFAHKIDQLIF